MQTLTRASVRSAARAIEAVCVELGEGEISVADALARVPEIVREVQLSVPNFLGPRRATPTNAPRRVSVMRARPRPRSTRTRAVRRGPPGEDSDPEPDEVAQSPARPLREAA